MVGDIDIFVLYRWALATVCGIYAAVRIWQSLWSWLSYFSQSHRRAVLGRYVGVLLLRLRLTLLFYRMMPTGTLLPSTMPVSRCGTSSSRETFVMSPYLRMVNSFW